VLLSSEGWSCNHKLVYRLDCEQGLTVRRRRRKRVARAQAGGAGAAALPRPDGPRYALVDGAAGGGRAHRAAECGRLAHFLDEFASIVGAEIIAIRGPQGWKNPDNGQAHCRVAEARLHTQGKTGLPGSCKPGNYVGFISFSIDVFDQLATRGWPRLTAPGERRVAAETFPTSAWRGLSLTSLPRKSSTTNDQLAGHTHLFTERLNVDSIVNRATMSYEPLWLVSELCRTCRERAAINS
jgi:hypothetical protein